MVATVPFRYPSVSGLWFVVCLTLIVSAIRALRGMLGTYEARFMAPNNTTIATHHSSLLYCDSRSPHSKDTWTSRLKDGELHVAISLWNLSRILPRCIERKPVTSQRTTRLTAIARTQCVRVRGLRLACLKEVDPVWELHL